MQPAPLINYSVDETRDMYSNAGVPVYPNTFESAFPAVHYSIHYTKLDVFEFLIVSGADIDSLIRTKKDVLC
jgi:hypothetical protein